MTMTMADLKAPPAPSSERRMNAWIGKAVRVEGKVISSEDLTIDGDVEGSIELGGHSLVIGPGASIKADLLATTIIVAGSVTGNVRAMEKIDLREGGSIEGNVVAPRFLMADGSTVRGKVEAG